MLTKPQHNLLRWLAAFPESLERAWDVPRELSLPGLADAMGVVRSGLNAPLKHLENEGYLNKRMAHVIGGGTRRRNVHHITQKGRDWLNEHGQESERFTALEHQSSVNAPFSPEPLRSLFGRDRAMAEVMALLDTEQCVQIHGMSGIGKTAFGRALAENVTSSRWATADAFSDAQSLAESWCPEVSAWPSDPASMAELIHLHVGDALYLLDDVHAIPKRHAAKVESLIHALRSAKLQVVVLAKPPIEFADGWPSHQLDALEPEEAMNLLPEHIEETERLHIAQALGGHPMALHLHQEGIVLPEAGESIQSYISTAVLGDLDEQNQRALDAMVLFPRPLSIHHLPHGEAIGELDDHALLRWSGSDERVEVQHVVRNVRRAMFSAQELLELHKQAAAHWKACGTTEEHQVLRLYHELASGHRSHDLEDRVQAVLPSQHRTLAVVLESATAQREGDEELHFLAGQVALHRMELNHVRHHLERLSEGGRQRRLAFGLASAEGAVDEATTILAAQLDRSTPLEAAKMLLAASVQALEDRVFDQPKSPREATVTEMLERIDLPEEPIHRTPLMVSMALVRHALALDVGEHDGAVAIRTSLEALSHRADPVLQAMILREDLHSNRVVQEGLVNRIESVASMQPTPFHEAMIRLSGVEQLVNRGSGQEALALFEKLSRPLTGQQQGQAWHRYCARWWYVRGHLYSKERRACLREAVQWFRRAGCHTAAESVLNRLHRVL